MGIIIRERTAIFYSLSLPLLDREVSDVHAPFDVIINKSSYCDTFGPHDEYRR